MLQRRNWRITHEVLYLNHRLVFGCSVGIGFGGLEFVSLGKLKTRRPINRYGKSNRSKERQRWQRELSRMWSATEITVCEVRLQDCVGSFGLSPAHSKKRRFIQTREDYFEIVAACQNCHRKLDEEMSHEEMEAKVKEIIGARCQQIE